MMQYAGGFAKLRQELITQLDRTPIIIEGHAQENPVTFLWRVECDLIARTHGNECITKRDHDGAWAIEAEIVNVDHNPDMPTNARRES